jgi:hypothetical protein
MQTPGKGLLAHATASCVGCSMPTCSVIGNVFARRRGLHAVRCSLVEGVHVCPLLFVSRQTGVWKQKGNRKLM